MKHPRAAPFLIAPPAQPVVVPSGQKVLFHDLIADRQGGGAVTYRFRFVAPGIARDGTGIGIDVAGGDMDALCDAFAIPRLPADAPVPAQVVISLSDRPVEFGVSSPDATQFFEAYQVENGACIWEGLY